MSSAIPGGESPVSLATHDTLSPDGAIMAKGRRGRPPRTGGARGGAPGTISANDTIARAMASGGRGVRAPARAGARGAPRTPAPARGGPAGAGGGRRHAGGAGRARGDRRGRL